MQHIIESNDDQIIIANTVWRPNQTAGEIQWTDQENQIARGTQKITRIEILTCKEDGRWDHTRLSERTIEAISKLKTELLYKEEDQFWD